MKKTIAVATALLLGTSVCAFAQGTKGGTSTMPQDQEMQGSPSDTSSGASQVNPGGHVQSKGTTGQSQSRGATRGSSQMAPGDRTNEPRSKY